MDIRSAMPDGWRVFFRERQVRDAQARAIPTFLRGTSALLSSPTASGKTEAALAPLFQRHVTFQRRQLSVVYVAPTRALVNDIYERLRAYFSASDPDLVQRYTGDHHDFSSPDGRFALIATPEALDSLQLTRPERLAGVRAVVCDELHVIDGTARGQQLRCVLQRLRAAAASPSDARDNFQTVAMTATVPDQAAVAARWCGPQGSVIEVGGTREIALSVLKPLNPGASTVADRLARQIQESGVEKALIFANTRNGAQQLAASLSDALPVGSWPVYLHIGVLGAAERERIESAMKRERRGICVATATLEVGIDIGDVDVVVLAEPPRTVTSFLQRIGRGNRRSDRCVVWAYAADDFEETVYLALEHSAARGWLDDTHEYERSSVEFQQILSLAWVALLDGWAATRKSLAQRAGRELSDTVIDDMLGSGALRLAGTALIPSDALCDLGDRRQIHSVIVGAAGTPLVDLRSGEIIGLAPTNPNKGGVIYAGSRKRLIRGADQEGVYLGGGMKTAGIPLARLPSSRGRRRGWSRQVVWAFAELDGRDPRAWTRAGGRLTTFGGEDYNALLSAVLTQFGTVKLALRGDAFGVSGLPDDWNPVPGEMMKAARTLLDARLVPEPVAKRFREGTQFLSMLGPEMQREEARRSVPWPGFFRWLSDCSVEQTATSNVGP